MSTQLRKKSSSFSGHNNAVKTINRNKCKQNPLSTCKSVCAFGQTVITRNNTRDIPRQAIQKLSNDNNRYNSTTRRNAYEKNSKTNVGQYKQAIDRKKKKVLSSYSSSNKPYNQQLLITIDTFHSTLCSLPLDKLILSENSSIWLQDQLKTLQRLRQKFVKISFTIQEQTKQYYLSKLNNVCHVLMNIGENLQTLGKMSVLRNYKSGGTSLGSRNSRSVSSLGVDGEGEIGRNGKMERGDRESWMKKDDLMREVKINQGPKSYHNTWQSYQGNDNFSIDNNSNIDKQNCPRYANQQISQQSRNISNIIPKREITEKDNFILKTYQSTIQDQDIVQKCHTIRSMDENDQTNSGRQLQLKNNRQEAIYGNYSQQVLTRHNDSKVMGEKECWRQQHQSNEMFKKRPNNMNKTISKYQRRSPESQHIEQDKNVGHFLSQQSKETFNTVANQQQCTLQSSGEFGDSTIRGVVNNNRTSSQHGNKNNLPIISLNSEQLNVLTNQLHIKNNLLISLQSRHSKQLQRLGKEFCQKEKHYLETIYELKSESDEREKAIKMLLVERQQKSDFLEVSAKGVKDRLQESKLLNEKIILLERTLETLTNDIRQFKLREEQLRETVQLERMRTKKTQKQLEEIEAEVDLKQNQLNQKEQQKSALSSHNDQLLKQLDVFIQTQEKMTVKEEIYKMKYFKLYAEFQKFKQKVNDDAEYWRRVCISCKREYKNGESDGDSEKEIELKQLIRFHKRRLLKE